MGWKRTINGTRVLGLGTRAKSGGQILCTSPQPLAPSPLHSAFTLTELLVVITIIAILASLITAGAVNALNAAKRARISTEINQMGQALEEFKTKYGAYPPNVFPTSFLTTNEIKINDANLKRFLTKSSGRSTELNTAQAVTTGNNNIETILTTGLRPSEALVLWLTGFSSDPTRPFSGSDLEITTVLDEETGTDVTDVITYDSFDDPLFDFDKGRLRFSRDDAGNRRFLTVYGQGGSGPAYIQLYEYYPSGSNEPYLYFNTTDSPETVVKNWESSEFFYRSPKDGSVFVFPLKRMKSNAPNSLPPPAVQFVEYVNQGKFQLLHAGLDDAWGDFGPIALQVSGSDQLEYIPPILFPTGPFTGDIADTLTNFTPGTLESAQE